MCPAKIHSSTHVTATRIALSSLQRATNPGTQKTSDGLKVIDEAWYASVTDKLSSYGFPTNNQGKLADGFEQALDRYTEEKIMAMSGGVSTDALVACATVASETWTHGGPVVAWMGTVLSTSAATLIAGLSDELAPGNGSRVRSLMASAVPAEEAMLICDIDYALSIESFARCGCDRAQLCMGHYMKAHANSRKNTSMPGRAFVEKAAGSSIVAAIDMLRVTTAAALKTKPAPADVEGGKWYEYVRSSSLPAPLWRRHYGSPVVLNCTSNRWLASGCILTGSRLSIGGYLTDCGAMASSTDNKEATYVSTVARDEKVWRESIGAAEVCIAVQISNTWNALLEEMSVLTRGSSLPFVVLENTSAAERVCLLTLDSSVLHAVLTDDADSMSLMDLCMAGVVSGYCDQAEDVMLHVYTNALFLAYGSAGAIFDDEHPQVYASLGRSLMAQSQYRPTSPASQTVCYTIIWSVLNGRHRTLEKGAYVKWELLEDAFRLDEQLHRWAQVERSICVKLCGKSWVNKVISRVDHIPANGKATPNQLWARTLRQVGSRHDCEVEALTAYLCAECECEPGVTCSLHSDRHSGSDAMGELAILMEKSRYGETAQLFGWLLCGVIWFRRALHLRCGFMGYAVILSGAEADITCA
ncbi:hypothetical protein BGZ99_007030 [Dissophora globulifera]|uniref:Uncharacterized protein n=1 Tax=Dissophora globulifera TaxID=979702 RepID=A0A9P6REK6_9FUNG|nr:hypothetical protein BGZ99_007030 [Dissophora globulifera]